jgi:hypothetical protein
MATDPSMVIFNTRKSLESLPLDKDLILSWRDGPVKEKSFTRRGRPRKSESGISAYFAGLWLTKVLANQLSSGKCKPTTQRSSTNKPVYEFVSWTDSSGNTDAAARKAVRSHTMRHCKPRQYESNSPPRVHHSPDSLFENHPGTLENEFKIYMATMPHEISTLDPFDCLPIRMRPYMLELFNKCKYLLCFPKLLTEYIKIQPVFMRRRFQLRHVSTIIL